MGGAAVKSDLPEIRDGLQQRIGELCRRLLPRGRMEGGQWVSSNPTVAGDDRKVPALKVRVSGGDAGAWIDHRNGRDGHKGDVIGLVAYLMRTDTKGAMAWARDFLGLRNMSREEREAMRFAGEARRQKEEKRAEDKRRWSLMEADRLFCTPAGEGIYGPAWCAGTAELGAGSAAEHHARAYFAARDCSVGDVATMWGKAMRFSAGTEWWKGATWETDAHGRKRKVAPGPLFPAFHTGMRSPIGVVTACHVTFLDPIRPSKAPVDNAKLMFGEKKGTVMELCTGAADRKPFWQSERPGLVVICEGIETGLSLAPEVERAGGRLWAAGDLGNMGNAPVHLNCCGEIIVARDNNHGNAQAQKQLEAALDALDRHGKPLTVMASTVGDDFNDLATGKDE